MDKPIFVDFETKICSAYLNAVAATVWDALGQATNPQDARQFIGAVEEAPTDGSAYARQSAQWVQIQVGNLHNDLTGRSAPDAHPVSAITGLQASLDQINLDLSGKAPASAGTAAGTSFSPTGSLAATNVQSAIAEVDGDVVANTGAIAALNNALNLLDTAAVKKSSLTGAAFIPAGTTAQRDTTQLGAFRYNSQLDLFEGVTSAGWGAVGGGITQGQADARYLQLTGGSLSGNLTAVANYVSTAQANAVNALTRKDYVDAADALKLNKQGGTTAPAAGMIGEILTQNSGNAEIGVAGAIGNMGNITLTPGVWDVQVFASFNPSAGIALAQVTGSLVAGTLGNISNCLLGANILAGVATRLVGEMSRLVVTANTTVTCTVRASGASGTCTANATINARRVA